MKKLLLALLFFPTLAFANPIDDKCPQHVKWGAPEPVRMWQDVPGTGC